jgi:sulfhydrogenase subunit beta (sulfur reductase)
MVTPGQPSPADRPATGVLPAERMDDLVGALRRRGYTVLAPTVREGAIAHREIASAAELPRGWTDRQEAGTYRLERDARNLYFGYNAGPQSWKQHLFPPRLRLWRAERTGSGFTVEAERAEAPRAAFLGVRACDLAAIAVQDRVFLGGLHQEPDYRRRREAFMVAVNCGQAAPTCFCTSTGSGPRAGPGFDLALTELRDGAGHRFLVEAGSERGAEVLAELPATPASETDVQEGERVSDATAAQVSRRLPEDIAATLRASYEHPRWEDVARRCLACTNCTLVCPTCFCVSVEDTTDLAGDHVGRSRRWDSCFTSQHSYIHGGSVHASTASRYRQWMTHKLSTWWEQFGTSGCVGCGRCIAWCPAAIDITEEAAAIAGPGPAG